MKKHIFADLLPFLLGVVLALPFVLLAIGAVCGTFFDCQTDHAFHSYIPLHDCEDYFCPVCGDPIQDFLVCPCCSSVVLDPHDFCPNCGGPLNENS